MRDVKKRVSPPDPWAVLAWIVVMAVLLLVLTAEALHPAPEAPTARERSARFAAQERYYETLDRYGDAVGAVEAARMAYEQEATVHEEG